jgi:hypothetical protein
MRRLSIIAVSALAALALAVNASAASALTLTEGSGASKKAVPKGGHALVAIAIEGCFGFSEGGDVKTNGKATDKASFTGSLVGECNEGALSGSIKGASLTNAGTASVKAALNFSPTGQCTYTYKSFDFSFAVPGEVDGEGTLAKGKLDKTLSESTCSKTAPTPVFFAVVTNGAEETLGDEP